MITIDHQLGVSTPSPLQKITPQWLHASDYDIWIKRDDLIHPVVSGNKWRKLSNILTQLIEKRVNHIGSFGGGYSNHIHALAYCCNRLGIAFTAFIRGDYSHNETPMLRDISRWHAQVVYTNKTDYKLRHEQNYLGQLATRYALDCIIPEGGSQPDCVIGMHHLLDEVDRPFDYMITPVASGGTLAGLATGSSQIKQLLGVAVLKGQGYLEELVANLIGEQCQLTPFKIMHDYHHGGYAKVSPELKAFCAESSVSLDIPFEPVYSGKALFALKHLIEQRYLPAGSSIVLLHTGGLQAAR